MQRKMILSLLLIIFSAANPGHAALINFSTASDSGNTAPLWIGADLGFFEKHGNAVRLNLIPGATVSITALLNNDVQLAQFSPMLAISNNAAVLGFAP